MLASWHGDYGTAHELFEAAVAVAEAAGDRRQIAVAKSGLGWATIGPRPTSARDDLEDAILIARELGDEQILFGALQGLTLAYLRLDDLGAVRGSVLEAIALGEASGEHYDNATNLLALGTIETREGDPDTGGQRIAEALRQLRAAGGHGGLSIALDLLATLAFERGAPERGARLAAAADRLRRDVGGGPSTAIILLEEPLDLARRTMAPVDYERAVAAGRELSTDEAVALGLEIAENRVALQTWFSTILAISDDGKSLGLDHADARISRKASGAQRQPNRTNRLPDSGMRRLWSRVCRTWVRWGGSRCHG